MVKGWGTLFLLSLFLVSILSPSRALASYDIAGPGVTPDIGFRFGYLPSHDPNTPQDIVFQWTRRTSFGTKWFHFYQIQVSYEVPMTAAKCRDDAHWQDFPLANFGPDGGAGQTIFHRVAGARTEITQPAHFRLLGATRIEDNFLPPGTPTIPWNAVYVLVRLACGDGNPMQPYLFPTDGQEVIIRFISNPIATVAIDGRSINDPPYSQPKDYTTTSIRVARDKNDPPQAHSVVFTPRSAEDQAQYHSKTANVAFDHNREISVRLPRQGDPTDQGEVTDVNLDSRDEGGGTRPDPTEAEDCGQYIGFSFSAQPIRIEIGKWFACQINNLIRTIVRYLERAFDAVPI